MKYCCEYGGEFGKLSFFDEIIIHLRPNDDLFDIQNFFTTHPKQEIIIQILDTEDFVNNNIFNRLIALLPITQYNYRLKLNNPYADSTGVLVGLCHEYNIPFFFDMLVGDWDILQSLIQFYPTEMYIVNSLGFDLPMVASILHHEDINIRIYPNIAQSTVPDSPSMTKFFVRPDDVDYYEDYVDTMEFLVNVNDNQLKEIYYCIYAEDMMWEGPLEVIIAGFEDHCDNRGIFNSFAIKRLMCSKECVKGRKCKYCFQVQEAANMITDDGYALQYPLSKNRKTAWSRLSKEEQDKLRDKLLEKLKNL